MTTDLAKGFAFLFLIISFSGCAGNSDMERRLMETERRMKEVERAKLATKKLLIETAKQREKVILPNKNIRR